MSTYEARRQTYLETIAAQAEMPPIAPDEVAGLIPREVFHLLPRLETGALAFGDALLQSALDRIAARQDCADFALAGLLRVLLRPLGDENDAKVTGAQRAAIENAALGYGYWYDQPRIGGCFHTENHQILFHSCELLAGQLFPDRVFANTGQTGAWHVEQGTQRTLQWINQRARFGFSEWLSCYFEEDLLALLNLYDFAEDFEIRRRAGLLMDLILFEIALHSHRGVLGGTHGRTYAEFVKGARRDPNTAIAWLVFGTGEWDGRATIALTALAASGYRCPAVIEAIAHDKRETLLCRERHGLSVEEAARWGIAPDRLDDAMFFWACQTARHPLARETAREVARIAGDAWLADFIEAVDAPLASCRTLVEEGGADFDGDAVNTALSAVHLTTYRTPDYLLSCAQDFRPGRPGYQQHIWQATLDADAVVFTNHPGARNESSAHGDRPNFWAGNRWLPRAAQTNNVLVCIHHVPVGDPLPFSHAYFPRAHFDEVVQRGHWTFGRNGDGYVALFSQHPARWVAPTEGEPVELRADARDNIWVCEMGSRTEHGDFERFIAAVAAAPVSCDGLAVAYHSPSRGEVRFGWTGPLTVAGETIALDDYPRFDNPYCRAELGTRRYEIACGDARHVLDFA